MDQQELNTYITTLQSEFEKHRNPEHAARQSAYMRNQFAYIGLTTPQRRELQKPFLVKAYLPPKNSLHQLITELWEMPERDYQMFALDLLKKYVKVIEEKDIELFEYTITNKSWWDSVDFLAAHMLGAYFEKFPEKRQAYVDKWLASGNIWLQRSAVLFQLNYKSNLDKEMLTYVIHSLLGSKEFFINKAIGWILRQYSRTNTDWVLAFVENTPELANLSKREAVRLINK